MKKNLFSFDTNNSSDASGSLVGQITCEPCSSECEKIKNKINKSSSACSPCNQECEKINERINKRKLEEIDSKEVPHLLKVFDF